MTNVLAGLAIASSPTPCQEFANFESPHTHSIAVSLDGKRLFALNSPAARLVEFSLAEPTRPVLRREIPVGLEPIALAQRNAQEVWVVNWLSDSVSVVSLDLGCVTSTIQVGDEPGDIVFAGSPRRAFVSVTGTREVVVIDPESRRQVERISIFADAPRAMCASRDRSKVWVAALRSGNGTTVIPEEVAPLPPPTTDEQLPSAPRQSLLVRADDPRWADHSNVVLPDYDVFGIDAQQHRVVAKISGVGTNLFDIAAAPHCEDLWVANTEARNLVRFEPMLRGHAVDNRITRITTGDAAEVFVHDLNPEADYSTMTANDDRGLAQPTAICFSPKGDRMFVAAFGSDRIAVIDPDGQIVSRIEVTPQAQRASPRQMRGPRSLAHHRDRPLLYVLNRVGHSIAVIDTETEAVLTETSLGADPTPRKIARGRGFLYSARLSGTGTMSCASCHLDGDWDGLAWDLGDPGGDMIVAKNRDLLPLRMHPMKGPMKTQTLRGLTPDVAPFHHRGDREQLHDFNPSFDDLMGGKELGVADINLFVDFLQSLTFPPNPNRNLDGSYPPGDGSTKGGEELFKTNFQGNASCLTCHSGPAGTSGLIMTGHLLQHQSQAMKVVHLRDVYKRTARAPRDGQSMSGFGLFHDGSADSVSEFLTRPFFRDFRREPAIRRELERFVNAFDTGTPPVVGWSKTVPPNTAAAGAELDTVERLATDGDCDLIVHGRLGGRLRTLVYDSEASLYRERHADGQAHTRAELFAELAQDDVITFYGLQAPETRDR